MERKEEDMRVLRVFFIGLIYGWLMRWLIDKIFLEDNLRSLASENAVLRQRILALEVPQAQQNRPVQRTAPASLPVEQVQPVAAKGSSPAPFQRDDLKMIKGVGPKLEKKLNDANVYTFDQMSRLKTSELQAILGVSRRNDQSTDNLISQAAKFAKKGPKG
jgi:predicted flap endonuclease-1-like 5' DNA nuclease